MLIQVAQVLSALLGKLAARSLKWLPRLHYENLKESGARSCTPAQTRLSECCEREMSKERKSRMSISVFAKFFISLSLSRSLFSHPARAVS
jgi:hypothetical protein